MDDWYSSECEDFNGIICICDALGVSNQSLRDSKRVINILGEIIDETTRDTFAEFVLEERSLPKPEFFTFGDTILSAWKIPKGETEYYVETFAFWAAHFINAALEKEIAFRGAFSLGDFVMDVAHHIVLGPAVSDAAGWYEKSEMIGVHCTPSTMFELERLIVSKPLDTQTPDHIPYLVKLPIATKIGQKTFWSVNWPDVPIVPLKHMGRRKQILEMLTKFQIPLGTEGKYENTWEFVDYCLRRGQERPSKSPEGAH